ncbi:MULTISPECIES: hypothetical protein [unclassified Micromonospora]|uniref:hypothetical protein n=1 Tax=unclassified Micromonospora TaxID=2617518 RepID=UPI00137607CB|nr:hypothetical protein [Verrucosispora sp. SN26_14.1]
MRTVGFFRELGPGATDVYAGSIEAHLGRQPLEDAPGVIDYLRHGHVLIDVMGAEVDVLGSGRHLVGGASVLTDGEWLWRDDLRFYVASYHLELPDEFLARIRRLQHQVPDLSTSELQAAGEEAFRRLGYQ